MIIAVTFTNKLPASVAGSNDKSGTIRVCASGVSLYNLNIVNTYGRPVEYVRSMLVEIDGIADDIPSLKLLP